MRKIKPLRDQLLCSFIWADVNQSQYIVMPEAYRKPTNEAKVRAVGPECKKDINIDDRVIYNRYQGITLTVDGRECFFIPETEIEAVLIPE